MKVAGDLLGSLAARPVVRLLLTTCSQAHLRRLADALKALVRISSYASEHVVLVRAHQSVLRLPVALVPIRGRRIAHHSCWLPARCQDTVVALIAIGGVRVVIRALLPMATDVPLDLVDDSWVVGPRDQLLRRYLGRLELGRLRRRCNSLFLVDAHRFTYQSCSAAALASWAKWLR